MTASPDRVRRDGVGIVIETPADMPEWEFREHRRTQIEVDGARYFVGEKRLLPDGTYRYLLEPWVDDLGVPGRAIVYDAGYVSARDAAARTAARREGVSRALFFVGPLLGFLPARVKLALDDRYGYDPQAVTQQSLFVQRIGFYCLCALFTLGRLAGVLRAWEGAFLAFIVVVLLDLVMRLGPAENGEAEQPGFLEWMVPGWKRRARRR